MGANSWFTMKWKLHPERGSFKTCSTSCTSTIVECKDQESTSRKRKRVQKEKSEEEKEKTKRARILKAQEKKEERQRAQELMKQELGSRESLKVTISDPEEIKKIERKEELRRNRELKKKSLANSSSTPEVTPKSKPKKVKRDPSQTVTKSFSVRIKPSKDQKQILNHWIGCARFTYNQGLSIVKEYTSRDSKPTINESLFQTIKGQVVPYDKVDRDKPWLHNCPEKIRAYAVHKELYRTYKSNFAKGGHKFEPKFRNRQGLQSIHMPKDKVLYCRETRRFRLFPNEKMKTEHFSNLSEESKVLPTLGVGEFNLFGSKLGTSTSRKRSRKKIKMVEECFGELLDKSGYSKSRFDVTFVRTASHKYEMRLTFDEDVRDVQERNQSKTPVKRFDSVFIDPGNRTFSTMYSPEGFAGSVGDKDVSRIFRMLKTHDKLQSESVKKFNRRNRSTPKTSKTREGEPDSLKGGSQIHLAVLREKIKNLRDEVHWQTISFLVKNFKNIFIPKLDTKNMIMKGSRNLNRKSVRQMLTWSHGMFMERLIGKAREFKDTHVHVVDECYTSKTCGSCGVINESLGSSKWFSCKRCGFQCERDLNGARNIFIKTVCEGVLEIM